MSATLYCRLTSALLRSGAPGRRTIVDGISRLVPSAARVGVPLKNGRTICVDARSYHGRKLLLAENTEWEPDEQAAMQRVVRPDTVVYDIGVNVGLHTAWLSTLVGPSGRVVAFEPNPALHPQLKVTAQLLGNMKLLPIALSDEVGTAAFFVPAGNSETSSLADWTGGEYGDVHRVECVTRPLDHLIAAGEVPRPDFVKCDVEGAELKVFAGARATLDREDAPTILFEANVHTARGFGLTVSSARDFLAALPRAQYRFFEVGRAGALTPSVDLHPVHSNLLAVPASRSI